MLRVLELSKDTGKVMETIEMFNVSRSSYFNWNGKVERLHLMDNNEFYQLQEYFDDLDLKKKIKQWEDFNNFHRPQRCI